MTGYGMELPPAGGLTSPWELPLRLGDIARHTCGAWCADGTHVVLAHGETVTALASTGWGHREPDGSSLVVVAVDKAPEAPPDDEGRPAWLVTYEDRPDLLADFG